MNRLEDMSTEELWSELTSLMKEQDELRKAWMVEDSDNEWDEVQREIDQVRKELRTRGDH